MTSQPFDSIPWTSETHGSTTLCHKQHVAYTSDANALQNLSIWISSTPAPPTSSIPQSSKPWIIYIHGGAWRDPDVDASSFSSTVSQLARHHSHTISEIGGIASINYSLTPRTHDPSDPDFSDDASRQAKHPDHIVDLLTALSFLQTRAGFASNYILLGHSCGATLAFQVAMNHSKWFDATASLIVAKPIAVIGLNGLYDMPALINSPGRKHEHLKAVYELFTRLAFGDDEIVWQEISPISVSDWKEEWAEGRKVVLVQSKEDSLVPYAQMADLKLSLDRSKGEGLEVIEMVAVGDHNDLWLDGARLAEIIAEVVRSLV